MGDVPDIQGVLKVARQYHIPVVPQGADTSTVIGADGLDGSINLSTARMKRIKEISKGDLLAVVEPGVINGDLDQAAENKAYFMRLTRDPSRFQALAGMLQRMQVA